MHKRIIYQYRCTCTSNYLLLWWTKKKNFYCRSPRWCSWSSNPAFSAIQKWLKHSSFVGNWQYSWSSRRPLTCRSSVTRFSKGWIPYRCRIPSSCLKKTKNQHTLDVYPPVRVNFSPSKCRAPNSRWKIFSHEPVRVSHNWNGPSSATTFSLQWQAVPW